MPAPSATLRSIAFPLRAAAISIIVILVVDKAEIKSKLVGDRMNKEPKIRVIVVGRGEQGHLRREKQPTEAFTLRVLQQMRFF